MVRISYACLAIALSLGVSHAGEKNIGAGAFCDSETTATEFLNKWDGSNATTAVDEINKAAGSKACMLSTVVLEEVERGKVVTTPTGKWQLTKLLIWGVDAGGGMMVSFTVPLTQYTFFGVPEEKLGQAI